MPITYWKMCHPNSTNILSIRNSNILITSFSVQYILSFVSCLTIEKENEKHKIAYCQNNFDIQYQIVEKGKIDTSNKQIPDHSLSWLGTGTSIISGRVKLVLWAQTSPLSEMMRSRKCKCFPHMRKMHANLHLHI